MIDYHLILGTLYSDKQWSMSGKDYNGLNWLDSSPKPTKEELDSKQELAQSTFIENQQEKETAKASALTKLTSLGLTADEVKALIS